MSLIPSTLHIIWLGDAALRPDRLIDTWVGHHPHWDIWLWNPDDLTSRDWKGRAWIDHHLQQGRIADAADVMRGEILAEHGGVCVAPDSVCLRPLDPLCQHKLFASRRHEQLHPGELCADYVGCVPRHPLITHMVQSLAAALPGSTDQEGTVAFDGSARLTFAWRALASLDLVRLPSDAFVPRHPERHHLPSGAAPYACEMWAGQLGLYPALGDIDPEQIVQTLQVAGVIRRPADAARAA